MTPILPSTLRNGSRLKLLIMLGALSGVTFSNADEVHTLLRVKLHTNKGTVVGYADQFELKGGGTKENLLASYGVQQIYFYRKLVLLRLPALDQWVDIEGAAYVGEQTIKDTILKGENDPSHKLVPVPIPVTTSKPSQVAITEIQRIEAFPGPIDGYDEGEIREVPQHLLDLIKTSTPVYSCGFGTELGAAYYISFNKAVAQDSLSAVCKGADDSAVLKLKDVFRVAAYNENED